jgi:hypothetical protein
MDLAIRWTIGNVTHEGFDAMDLSIQSAFQLFGPGATYAVCVNTIDISEAQERVGEIPFPVEWIDSSDYVPEWLGERCDEAMGEGVCWKLCPVRLYPAMHELALDNDVILWGLPKAVENWLDSDNPVDSVIAADVSCCFGKFAERCGSAPRNSGIRGLSPHFDYEAELREELNHTHIHFSSELDEQGLQVATLQRATHPKVVTVEEVTICSPFWPHRNYLGTCGAHFVGLNTKHLPWSYYDRPADEWKREHWNRLRPEVESKIQQIKPRDSLLAVK